jgi:hypothetical protein
MNARQVAFYRQARSDWSVFRHFHPDEPRWWTTMQGAWCGVVGVRPFSFAPCHELHYLQMCSEKLAKAYYTAPPRGHDAFRRFLTDLMSNTRAAIPLGFAGFAGLAGLTRWEGSVRRIVGAIEDLAPQIADRRRLPNPEYPWPRGAETHAPADYSFQTEVYTLLDAQARSGEPPFLTVFGRMVDTMQSTGWHL